MTKTARLGLTDASCRNVTCEGLKVRKLHDGGGLYLWVYKDGKKYWRMRYTKEGKEQLLSLGVYPRVGLKEARSRAGVIIEQREQGLDPSLERKQAVTHEKARRAHSFEVVAVEWYDKVSPTWAKTHAVDVKRRLESNIFPLLGHCPLGEIEAPQLLEAIRTIEARGAYDLAHRVLGVCGQVFRYGIATGKCTRDLSADLRGALTPHIKKHQAAIRTQDLPDLMKALIAYDQIGDRQTGLALQLLALTFVRTNELIGSTWEEFDMDKALWMIPATRMKMRTEHWVPLSRQALNLLEELKGLSGGSAFVFPGRNPRKTISENTMLFALYRLGYKSKMTGHGFRAIASTILNEESSFKPDVIERQLAHCERNKIRGAYNRAEYLTERKAMMQWWGDYLEQVVSTSDV